MKIINIFVNILYFVNGHVEDAISTIINGISNHTSNTVYDPNENNSINLSSDLI